MRSSYALTYNACCCLHSCKGAAGGMLILGRDIRAFCYKLKDGLHKLVSLVDAIRKVKLI